MAVPKHWYKPGVAALDVADVASATGETLDNSCDAGELEVAKVCVADAAGEKLDN